MYGDLLKALSHTKTLLSYTPSDDQLRSLEKSVQTWLNKAKEKNTANPGTVSKWITTYEWLIKLVDSVMAKEISFTDAVNEISKYELKLMYANPRKALGHVKTLLKYNPNDDQLHSLQSCVHTWLTEAKQIDADNPETVGKCSAPYTWLYNLVERVMAKEISFADAVEKIRDYERE